MLTVLNYKNSQIQRMSQKQIYSQMLFNEVINHSYNYYENFICLLNLSSYVLHTMGSRECAIFEAQHWLCRSSSILGLIVPAGFFYKILIMPSFSE